MKAAVALFVAIAMLGCFPNNPRHRTYAKYAEGASLIAGIGISAFANTGADCDEMEMPGPNVENNCHTKAKWIGTAGVVLILAGLLGFVATISTAEDQELKKVNAELAKQAEPKPNVKLPPGVAPGQTAQPAAGEGSAAPADDKTAQPSGSASTAPSAPL